VTGRDRRPRVTHHRSFRDLAAKRRPPVQVSRPASESSRRRGLMNAVEHHCNSAGLVANYLVVASRPRLLPAKTAVVPHRGWHDEPASGSAMVRAERQFGSEMSCERPRTGHVLAAPCARSVPRPYAGWDRGARDHGQRYGQGKIVVERLDFGVPDDGRQTEGRF
jgi:hypothetical protein